MIPLQEARAFVLDCVAPLGIREVALHDAVGLVLGEDVTSTTDVPPFANSAMDGIAVRAADTGPGARLRVTSTVAAGDPPDADVDAGEAVRIMTGAPIPAGADAVVMVELLSFDGADVVLERGVEVGTAIRPAGDDLRRGQVALRAGSVVSPAVIGVAATVGREELPVFRRATVGVFSTGDELVDPGVALLPGQIHDSNRHALLALVEDAGCTPVDLGRLADDEAAIEGALREATERCDAIVTSGGVSMGEFDYVKSVLARIGDMRWMQVAIRPAKPLAVGTIASSTGHPVPVFGLPGNPVSSHVSFELFARPALRKMMGHARLDRRRFTAVLPDGVTRRRDGKVHYDRVGLDVDGAGRIVAHALAQQGSHHTAAMAAAAGLAEIPDGEGIAPGGTVEVLPLGVEW